MTSPPDTDPAQRLRLFRPAGRTARLWLLAMLVGVLAAAATVLLRGAARGVEWLATGQTGGLVDAALSLPPWQRVLVGCVGGLLAGAVLALGNAWARRAPAGDKHLDYIDAARHARVDLNDRTTHTRTLSALLSVGTGASIGREGPMVQMAAWLAARLARALPLSDQERATLLVCGIAAGIGSVYHAPVAGVVFVLELALGFWVPNAVAPVLIASATANALIYWFVEPLPLYAVPRLPMLPTSLGAALLAGLAFGAVGWALLVLLERARSLFGRIASPVWRLGLGGLLTGLLSALVPQVWGNGYSVISSVLQGELLWQLLALVLVAKVLATALSSGSGAIGGVFTPSLLVGAASGSVLAQLALLVLPMAWVGDAKVMAVLGMAAVLAAVTHAPLMAVVMVMEMTQAFELTLPTMLACGVAYAVSSQFGGRPLYGNPIEAHR
ncbi:MAG: chloride channel protein [Proteobacteria bacterium]|nr:chloride channel protein [Pseudomonadota bacterium]